jgi:hypothetical protein
MSFAVLEKTLSDLPLEHLTRAFAQMPNLTKQDAAVRARDAAGVLATHLSQADAAVLCRAHGAEGLAALPVDQDSLPLLPKARVVRRMIPADGAMVLYDALAREQRIPWTAVTLLAAGNVTEVDPKHARFSPEMVHAARGVMALADLEAKQSIRLNLCLEVLLSCEPHRCYVEGNTFSYEYLGPRRSNRSADNFVAFIRDVIRRVPLAVRNRGAELLRADPPKAMAYPSRHAFEQEIVWQLWSRKKTVALA